MINLDFLQAVEKLFPGDVARLGRMSLIEEGFPKMVRMAHLAVIGSHKVRTNGFLTPLRPSRMLNSTSSCICRSTASPSFTRSSSRATSSRTLSRSSAATTSSVRRDRLAL